MITHSDDGPDFEPDDPLAVILRPPSDYLGPPAGRYEAIRRGAARRRLLRAAVGAGLSCAVAALIALPLRLAAPDAPPSPTVPLAPPPASSSPTVPAPPAPSASPGPVSPSPSPSGGSRTHSATAPTRAAVPTRAPSATPASPSLEPPAPAATPESSTRP
ncbi:hypothetical protein AB0D78_44630 [Streptomyces avermitilis]|uniref:hypothetical protein n=1 Tax=Streptomyces avermitilis TaxID=33903 RepID=UPI0033F801D6